MKIVLFALLAGAAFLPAAFAQSQAPVAPQSAAQKLQSLRAKNKELLDRQSATLRKLEELQLEAQQLKFLGKRA